MTATLRRKGRVRTHVDARARRLRRSTSPTASASPTARPPSGPESGEESFILERRDDDTVWLTIRSLLAHPRRHPCASCAPAPAAQAARAHPRRAPRPASRGRRVADGLRPAARRARPRSTALLPASAPIGAAERAFGVYLHVPFCRVRCGYCDFNTYTAGELRGARQADYADHAIGEIRMSRRRARGIRRARPRPAATVFFGGGTPTLLPAGDLVRMLDAVRDEFGLAPAPRSRPRRTPTRSTPTTCGASPTAGSRGSRSACSRPCRTCSRRSIARTIPRAIPLVVALGARGRASTSASTSSTARRGSRSPTGGAVARARRSPQRPDHSQRVRAHRRGRHEARPADPPRRARRSPTTTSQADMYELADELLGAAGYEWYEVSNWATRRRAPLAAQPRLLARRRLVGRRPRRAQPRRRRALVEREASGRVRRTRRRRRLAGGRPRGARRRDARDRARAAAARASARASPIAVAARRRPARGRRPHRRRPRRREEPPSPVCSTLTMRGRLLADAVVQAPARGLSPLSSRT